MQCITGSDELSDRLLQMLYVDTGYADQVVELSRDILGRLILFQVSLKFRRFRSYEGNSLLLYLGQ